MRRAGFPACRLGRLSSRPSGYRAGKPGEPADRNVCPTKECLPLQIILVVGEPRSESAGMGKSGTAGRQHLISGFHSRDHLPHLKREGASYFVTFRLAGTLPREVLLRFKLERELILAQAIAAKRPL